MIYLVTYRPLVGDGGIEPPVSRSQAERRTGWLISVEASWGVAPLHRLCRPVALYLLSRRGAYSQIRTENPLFTRQPLFHLELSRQAVVRGFGPR